MSTERKEESPCQAPVWMAPPKMEGLMYSTEGQNATWDRRVIGVRWESVRCQMGVGSVSEAVGWISDGLQRRVSGRQ